jgi:hypothetical protein
MGWNYKTAKESKANRNEMGGLEANEGGGRSERSSEGRRSWKGDSQKRGGRVDGEGGKAVDTGISHPY